MKCCPFFPQQQKVKHLNQWFCLTLDFNCGQCMTIAIDTPSNKVKSVLITDRINEMEFLMGQQGQLCQHHHACQMTSANLSTCTFKLSMLSQFDINLRFIPTYSDINSWNKTGSTKCMHDACIPRITKNGRNFILETWNNDNIQHRAVKDRTFTGSTIISHLTVFLGLP